MTKFTLMQLISHDFVRSLRVWKGSFSRDEVFIMLIGQQAKSMSKGMKNYGIAAFGAIWLSAREIALTVNLPMVKGFSIPAVIVLVIVATATAVFIVEFTNYLVLGNLQQKVSTKLFRFDNSTALGILHAGESAWMVGLIPQFRFFESSTAHKFASWASLLSIFPVLIIVIAIYGTITSVGVDILKVYGLLSVQGTFAAAALLSIALPLVLIVLFLFPFKFTKNVSYIRWDFLSRMYKKQGRSPPRMTNWLGEDRDKDA